MSEAIDKITRLKNGEELTIGSGVADIRIAGEGVAPQHFQIRRQDNEFLLRDLNTPMGTFVNGVAARGAVHVKGGDKIRVGTVTVIFPASTSATVAPTPTRVPGAPCIALTNARKTVSINRVKTNILDDVSFSVKPGEFVGILGSSGSGKSTLIKALAGLIGLSEGNALRHGLIASSSALQHDHKIAYMPQDVVIHEALTPRVALGYIAVLKEIGNSEAERREVVRSVMERVGIADRADVPITRLSGGQRKRVALAAELIGDPEVLLLDEATSGLDPASEEEMMILFQSLAREGKTVVCITHFPDRLRMCDRLTYLMNGKVVFQGTPSEMVRFFGVDTIEDIYTKQREKSADEWRQDFQKQYGKPIALAVAGHLPEQTHTTAGNREQWATLRGYLEIKCLYFRHFAFCLDNGSRWCFRWERAAVTATQYSPT